MSLALKDTYKTYLLPSTVFVFTFFILSVIQLMLKDRPLILPERFIAGSGWLWIFIIACYGAFISYKMQFPSNVPKWRKISWTIFSVVFFSQLIIGLLGVEKFLMTGKLHLPIPLMILSGPLYRGHLSVMTILFISTILLTGPAWCSQLCYFGAFDNFAAGRKPQKGALKNKKAIKSTLLFIIIAVTLLLRWLNVPLLAATLIATGFGITGVAIIVFISRKKGKMVHCILYCPIGTLVNILSPVNPFRLYIDNSCTLCMRCSSFCKYDALNVKDIRNMKPDFSCTLCGDCLAACHENSIKYRFIKLKPETARNLYLFISISLHAVFLALARM